MNFPHQWITFGPGLMLPVFFLSVCPVSGQMNSQETKVVACGGAFVSSSGFSNALSNQAGLGWVNSRSLSIQHTRPFVATNLGISSLSVQLPAGNGAFGTTFTCFGIKGLYNTSGWVSYGMKLNPGITAGVGIHFWFSTIQDGFIYHPGISCGLGIQARINDRLVIGGHVMNPAGWSSEYPGRADPQMTLTAGCSYSFFNAAIYHADLHISTGKRLRISHGIELTVSDILRLLFGLHNLPYAASVGIEIETSAWNIQVAVEYLADTGNIPSSALTYVW